SSLPPREVMIPGMTCYSRGRAGVAGTGTPMPRFLAPLWQRCLPLISGTFLVALVIVGILLDTPPKALACFLVAYAMLGISAWSLWRKNQSDIASLKEEVARLQEEFERLKDLGTVEVDVQAKRRQEADRHLAGLSDAEKCALRQLLFINGLFSEQLETM